MRRLWALVHGLPPDAATWRQDHEWTTEHELLASFMELFDHWSRQHAVLGGRPLKKADLPKPLRIVRPHEQEQQKKVETDPRAIAAFFRQHIK